MCKSYLFIITAVLIICYQSVAATTEDSLTVSPFGKVFIYKSVNLPDNVVIMISGDGGWKSGVIGFARKFSEMNSLVIGVDIRRYFKELRLRSGDCYSVAADFVELSTAIEKKYNFSDYKPPVIMGYSSGATLVYGILAQARPGTFMGGISLGFCPEIDLPKMLCQTNGLTESVEVKGKSYILRPDASLGNPWIVLHGKLDKVCSYSEAVDFVGKTRDAELITLPEVGHGFSKWSDFMPQWEDAFKRLIGKFNESQSSEDNTDQLKGIPFVITDSKSGNLNAAIALLISGDGGWYSFEQSIADDLAKLGVPTIGLDSKKYFWNRKTPEKTTGDMALALNYYSKVWRKDQYILIGYSLGAEIVPFIVNRLPAEIKQNLLSTVLLSPDTRTDFEIHISNMLGIGNSHNEFNVIDEITKMPSINKLIIFGDSETTKVPDLLAGTGVKISKIPGDHHYKFNHSLIVETMKNNKVF
jgi:type IV secretory pathway VirJ component